MATIVRRELGTQFFDNNGAPLAGGKLTYYEGGTSTHADTYSNAAGTVVNTMTAGAIVLNSAGRLTEAVYLGSAITSYKERLTTASGTLIFEDDGIPAAEAAAAATTFAAPELPWVTRSASATLAAADFCGWAISGDTSSGNVSLILPTSAAAENGKAGLIMKAATANTLTILPQGAETINGAASLALTAQYAAVLLIPNGTDWRAVEFLADGTVTAARLASTFITAMTALTAVDRAADSLLIWDASASGFRRVLAKYLDNREPNALHSLSVADKDLTAPPGSPAEGDRYIVGAGATGGWSGQDGKIASYFDSAWAFYTPVEGWLCWASDENALYVYNGSAWVLYASTVPAVGITTAYGASCILKCIEQETTLSGATTNAATQIPIGTVLAVCNRVTQAITGSGVTSYSCGVGGEAGKFGSTLGLTLGSTNRGHIGPTGYYSATDLVFTAAGGSFSGGKVRSQIWYLEFTPATS